MHIMTDKEIDNLLGIEEQDYDKNFLKARNNGLLLTDNQVKILERYNIDPGKCGSSRELLYMIDEALDGMDEDEYAVVHPRTPGCASYGIACQSSQLCHGLQAAGRSFGLGVQLETCHA